MDGPSPGHQAQGGTLGEERAAVRELAGADLRARQVGEDSHRAAGRGGPLADHRQPAQVLVQLAVAEVQAEDVDAGREQLVDAGRGLGRGPERGHDLRRAAHDLLPTHAPPA